MGFWDQLLFYQVELVVEAEESNGTQRKQSAGTAKTEENLVQAGSCVSKNNLVMFYQIHLLLLLHYLSLLSKERALFHISDTLFAVKFALFYSQSGL